MSSSIDADPVPVNVGPPSSSIIDADADPNSPARDEARLSVDVVSSSTPSFLSSSSLPNAVTSSEKTALLTDDSCTIEFIKSAPYALGCAVLVG